MIFYKPRSYASASIMTDNGGLLNPQVLHQPLNVVGHRALVITARRFISGTIAAQIRVDDAIMLRDGGDLVTPGIPSLREAVEQDPCRAFSRFYEVHAQTV